MQAREFAWHADGMLMATNFEDRGVEHEQQCAGAQWPMKAGSVYS